MNEIKSWVTERKKKSAVERDGRQSVGVGRGRYIQWQGKRKGDSERESMNRMRITVATK